MPTKMNQQPEIFFPGGGYQMNNANRSPGSRPGYNTTAGLPSINRVAQRQMDNPGQSPAGLFPGGGDDRFGSYDSNAYRHNRIQPSPGFDGFAANNQAWAYNSGANTVNGAGDSRLRPGARRAAIPSEWTMPEQPTLGSQALNTPSTQYSAVANNFNPAMGLMNGDGGFGNDRHGYPNAMYDPRHDPKSLPSDLIPTAIVIKNIPFNVRKEMLTTIMSELGLPQPYAFNYHFDNGIFRGLAFANFQSPMDTQTVIEQLNGYEVQGRKLRVEYKKMLPEHERERIEREKREKRGQLEEQHQPIALHAQTSMHSLNAAHTSRSRTSPLRESPTGVISRNGAPLTAGLPGDVNLNDPDTLNFYTELTLFRNDPNREIIIFPSTITPMQRRTVHILAHNMGLEHRSVGEGQHRQLHVVKENGTTASMAAPMSLPAGVSADAHRRGLSRAATIDFAETRANLSGQFGTLGRQGRHGPTLELPDSPDGGMNLRGVKSFADLRSYTPSPSLSTSGYPQSNNVHAPNVAQFGEYSANLGQTSSLTTPTTPGTSSNNDPSSLLSDLKTMSLNDPYGARSLRPRENPGAIGSQRPLNGTSRNAPDRQPHGPNKDWGDAIGFPGRRTNGHVQRGSDSSDNATRGTAPPSAPRF